jgi:hypothetical protein
MPTPARRRSRIAHFQAPFLFSLAGTAAGAGCGGYALSDDASADDQRRQVSQGGQSSVPTNGDGTGGTAPVSSNPPRACNTPAPPPNACAVGWTCIDGEWDPPPSCNPPWIMPPPAPPVEPCPAGLPVPGSDCSGEGQLCGYPGCEGATWDTATCSAGQWFVEMPPGPACNPPPVVPVCPQRAIAAFTPCAYEEQRCGGALCGIGHVCTRGIWVNDFASCLSDAGADASVPAEQDAGL